MQHYFAMQNEFTITDTPKQPAREQFASKVDHQAALYEWAAAKSLAQGARTEKMMARVAAANPGANPSEELIARWFFGQSLLRGPIESPEACVAHVNEFAEKYGVQYRAVSATLLHGRPTEFVIAAL